MGMWLTFEPVLVHAGQYAKKIATARHGYHPAADSRALARYALAPDLQFSDYKFISSAIKRDGRRGGR